MTLSSLFSTFQFDHTDFDRDGLPGYASCILIELWYDTVEGYYVKVLYRRDNINKLIDLTPHILGCNDKCKLERFKQRSLIFKPQPDQETLCKSPLTNYKTSWNDLWNSSANVKNKLEITIIILFLIFSLKFV